MSTTAAPCSLGVGSITTRQGKDRSVPTTRRASRPASSRRRCKRNWSSSERRWVCGQYTVIRKRRPLGSKGGRSLPSTREWNKGIIFASCGGAPPPNSLLGAHGRRRPNGSLHQASCPTGRTARLPRLLQPPPHLLTTLPRTGWGADGASAPILLRGSAVTTSRRPSSRGRAIDGASFPSSPLPVF